MAQLQLKKARELKGGLLLKGEGRPKPRDGFDAKVVRTLVEVMSFFVDDD